MVTGKQTWIELADKQFLLQSACTLHFAKHLGANDAVYACINCGMYVVVLNPSL
jgi:hypothetical protein